jgi:peroxiredoxin Q/BCP
MARMPSVGELAPTFSLPTAGGGRVDLSALQGRFVVVFFYPKDDTSGCTQEALSFTRHADAFEAAGAVVIGISKDGVASHDRFIAKHGLRLVLAADESVEAAQRYGVWGEKTLYGRKYLGVTRATFLIDPNGKIAHIWPKVKPAAHGEEFLRVLNEISSKG